jgi:hypothetical protein
MNPIHYKFAQMLEKELETKPRVRVHFSKNKTEFYERMLSLKTEVVKNENGFFEEVKFLYDEIIEDRVTELNIEELAGYRTSDTEEELDQFKKENSKLIELAKKLYPKFSKEMLQFKFTNYLLTLQQKAVCVYFNLPSSKHITFSELCNQESSKDLVKAKVKEDLYHKAYLEKLKINQEVEKLAAELDEETLASAKEHTQSIHEWLDNIIENTKIEQAEDVNQILDCWPVVFYPCPWEIKLDE